MTYPKRSVEARTIAHARSRAAKWKRVRFRDNRVEETKSASAHGHGCWCGEPYPHTWPGQDEGAPHPAPKTDPGIPPRVRLRMQQQALQEAGVCPVCLGYPTVLNSYGIPHCDPCLGMGIFPPPKRDEWEQWRKDMLAAMVPDWGERYAAGKGLYPSYWTDEDHPVWMFRKGQRVRFYDQHGEQVGPEQANVAPAVAYAHAEGWRTTMHEGRDVTLL